MSPLTPVPAQHCTGCVHAPHRRLPALEAEVVALRERMVEHDRWEQERVAGANGGGT